MTCVIPQVFPVSLSTIVSICRPREALTSSQSPSLDRSSAPAEGESLEGENGILIAILAAAAIIAGIIIIADDDDDDEPTSP